MNLNKTLMFALGASVLGILVASAPVEQSFATGNGAPSGPHYNLNIIGQKSTNCPQTDGSGGSRIFVELNTKAGIPDKIMLNQSSSFYVLDDNACTDGVAQFELPAPVTSTGAAAYTVWARVQGTPGGHGTIQTCATDPTTGEQVCSTGMTIGTRDLGNKFRNVTPDLTQVCYIPSGSTTQTCVNIFDSSLYGYYWSYDNSGNKVLQLRFYPA